MKSENKRKNGVEDEFLAGARRAFKRVARQLRTENGTLGLPLITAKKGRVYVVRPAATRKAAAR
jgi:hypothetical protein